MDRATAELLAPGPKEEGWNKGGVDIVKVIEAAPGGAKENYLLEIDKDGDPSVTIIGAADFESTVPKSWKAKLHAGSSKVPAVTDSLTISALDERYFLAGWESRKIVGDASCSGAIGGYLYESADPNAKSEMPPEIVPIIFHRAATVFEKIQVCVRYDREGDGFRVRHFLQDGRSLPNLDAMAGITKIVKARPIEQLLVKPAK